MSTEIRQESRQIAFYEGEFLVKVLESEEEVRRAYHLRHRVFAEKLRWVPESNDRLESDIYDAWSTSIGLFSNQQLLGMVRMTPAPFPFMLESEFSGCLAGSHRVRKDLDTAEITRLAVDPAIADRGLSARLVQTIFKGIYHWSLANNIRYTYLVVESRLIRMLQRLGISCDPLGPPVSLPPAGALSVAATMDIVKCEKELAQRRPQLMNWMATTAPVEEMVLQG
jgi:acyl homoserine lactone synthase